MAQLKDLLVAGPSRFIGDMFGNTLQITKVLAPTTSGGSTYGAGSNNQVLRTNGASIYWGSNVTSNEVYMNWSNPTTPNTDKQINLTVNGATAGTIKFVAGSNVTLTAAAGSPNTITIASSYTNSRDPGYGGIKVGANSTAVTAVTAQSSDVTLAAKTYNETYTFKPVNKWIMLQGTNSDTAGSDVINIGHALSAQTAGTFGSTDNQTPAHGATFNVPYLKTDAAGHITEAGTKTVTLPADNDHRDSGYGQIKVGANSSAVTAVTAQASDVTIQAATYNELFTFKPVNKWVMLQGTNSGTAGSDVINIGHTLSGVTKGTYGSTSAQTPAYGGTFTVPYVTVDEAGHVTSAGTATTKIPAAHNGYGGIKVVKNSTAVTAPTSLTADTTITAVVPNETFTFQPENKWVGLYASNSSNNGSDVIKIGHVLSSQTAGTFGSTSNQTPAVESTFNVPYLKTDAAGHITEAGAKTVTLPALGDAYLRWGGANFSGDFSPLDSVFNNRLRGNRFAGFDPSGTTVQYSSDGGSTWTNSTDSVITNTMKKALFTTNTSLRLVQSGNVTNNSQLRIIMNTGAGGVYTYLRKIMIYITTNYSNGCKVTIEAALQNDPDNYTLKICENQPIAGWSGWNVINTGFTTYGNTAGSQYGRIRFTFKHDSITSGKEANGLVVQSIYGYGGVGWIAPSTLAYTDHVYIFDQDFNVTFPNKVTANNGFYGNLSGNATSASYPEGFSSMSTNATWGNQTGTTITAWNESNGGSIDFRRDNPSSGKLSIKVDGRFYGAEGNKPAMLLTSANGYWGMGDPDGNDNVWIRTTTQGIIPYQSGGVGSGHNGIGTSSWYFSTSYIDSMFSHMLTLGGATNATMTSATTNPRIVFQEGTDTQPVILAYTDQDSYRAPAGLKIVGGTSATPAWLEVEGQLRSNDSIRVIKNGASSDTGPDAIVYIENKDNSDWAQKILLDTANYGLYIQGTGTNLLKVGTNSVLIVQDHASTANSRTATVNGLLKVTNNSNTVTIGSQNANWCHFTNSADIPFYFDKAIHAVTGFTIYNTNNNWRDGYLTVSKNDGTDAYIELDRKTNANWRLLNHGGNLYLQSDWTTAKTTYYNVAIADYNTGNITIVKGNVWIQGGSNAGGNVNRMALSAGMPTGLQYNSSQRGVRIWANAIAFADPYNGNTNNDAGWIRQIEETANSGSLEIAVGDDGNEPIYVRQYNTSNAVKNEAILLSSTGATSFPVSVNVGSTTAGGIGLAQTNGLGSGISLYDGPKAAGAVEYGLFFGKTATFGTLGDVTSDWATYFTMSRHDTRGWIFKSNAGAANTNNNVASVSGRGRFTGTLGPSSWLDGQRYMNAAYNIADYSNNNSYNPWMRATNTWATGAEDAKVGKWFSFGTLGDKFYWMGSTTTRTGNSYDHSLIYNISNGNLSVDGDLYIGLSSGGNRGIYYTGTKNTYEMITFLDNTADQYGNGIKIGGGGLVVIGAGESAGAINVAAGTEDAYLLADGNVFVEANANTAANRVGFKVDTGGHIVPIKAEANNNLVQNIGADGVAFKGVYAGNVYLRRQNSTAYGRVSFYQPNYTTWISYMSNAAAGACPTGGTPSTLGDVTNWAQRSIIEQSANYGWIWESCANGTVSENTTKPTPRMALNANNGNLFIRGNVFLSSEAGETDRSLVFAYRDGTTLTNDNGASWRLIHKASGSGDGNYFAIESSTSTTGNSKAWNNVLRAGMNTYNILLSSATDVSAADSATTDAALTVSGGIQTIKGIKIGKFTNTSTAPGYGIKIHDLRNITVTSEIFGQQSVNWYFKQINGNWATSMHMKGWTGSYYSWEIAGNAHNSSIDRYYVRTNSNSAAGTWHTLVYLPAFAAVGGEKKPVYIDANGKVTECGTLVNYAFKTQTEYNAITTPDADTIYFIYESV